MKIGALILPGDVTLLVSCIDVALLTDEIVSNPNFTRMVVAVRFFNFEADSRPRDVMDARAARLRVVHGILCGAEIIASLHTRPTSILFYLTFCLSQGSTAVFVGYGLQMLVCARG